MTGTRPTLAVLADELGVSRTTVSNAFNRPDQLSPALRERVLAAADRLGYTGPDPLARGLARGRVGVVGLLVATPAGFAFADPAMRVILDGLVSTLAAAHTGLLLLPRPDGASPTAAATDPSPTVDASHPVATVPVDGFVVLSGAAGDPVIATARKRGLPMVAIDQPATIRGLVTRVDDHGGALAAARHIRELGHQRVAVVALRLAFGDDGGPFDPAGVNRRHSRLAVDRLRGHLDGLGDVDPLMCWEAPTSHRDHGRRAVREILAAHPDVTALLVGSDEIALGAIEELHQLGRHVPDDVSVVGFDDVAEAAGAPVPLTTVHQPLFERGTEAGDLLLALIDGRRPRRPAVRPVHLVIRASTGPARR